MIEGFWSFFEGVYGSFSRVSTQCCREGVTERVSIENLRTGNSWVVVSHKRPSMSGVSRGGVKTVLECWSGPQNMLGARSAGEVSRALEW